MDPNLIKEQEERYVQRKKAKRDLDKLINLSAKKGERKSFKLSAKSKGDNIVRLLDEGHVVDSAGHPLFLIKKGAIEKWYNGLSSDYVGSINLGHMDHATYPIILGTWTKNDLQLIDIEDGRKAIDVKLNLNEKLNVVKDLKTLGYPIGVSAEFFYEVDYKSSELVGMEVLSSIDIKDFAIVGEAGNANSGGVFLNGGKEMSKEKKEELSFIEKLKAKYLKFDEQEEKEPVVEETESHEGNEDQQILEEVAEQFEKTIEENTELVKENTELNELVQLLSAENEELKKQLNVDNKVAKSVLEKLKVSVQKKGSQINSERDKNEKLKQSMEKHQDPYGGSDDGLGV